MPAARYYSLRRLSPYQGVAQVVELPGFRAMSVDGERWRVQFLKLRSRLSAYAVWREEGRGNLIETEHTQAIVDALRERPTLPFPLADALELWLLDARAQRPLALLASALPERTPPRAPAARWVSALAGDDGFQAPSLSEASVTHMPHGEVLDRCVQRAAGPRPRAQWFRRTADGGGVGLAGQGLQDDLADRCLAAGDFPELLLRTTWDSERERDLVRDYHEWQAPLLLTHANLAPATRERLERAACRRAATLYRLRRLLPLVLDEERVRVAFVEAVLRGVA